VRNIVKTAERDRLARAAEFDRAARGHSEL
jgi:hypothetical protein